MDNNEYLEAFNFVMNEVVLPRKYGKSLMFTTCMNKVINATVKAKKYEKLIDLIESSNMDIDSVYNLLYIHAAEVDLNDENHIEVLNKLIKEGKVKGYEK